MYIHVVGGRFISPESNLVIILLNSSYLAVRISSDSHCVYTVLDKVYGNHNAFAVYCIKNHSKCNFFLVQTTITHMLPSAHALFCPG